MSTISFHYEDLNDGYTPGLMASKYAGSDTNFEESSSSATTKLAVYSGKVSSNFLAVFDDLLPTEWCDFAYSYAVSQSLLHRKHSWG